MVTPLLENKSNLNRGFQIADQLGIQPQIEVQQAKLLSGWSGEDFPFSLAIIDAHGQIVIAFLHEQ